MPVLRTSCVTPTLSSCQSCSRSHSFSSRLCSQAAREINSLRGPARQAAQDWLQDVRNHLEVSQMLAAVRQYLSLLGLSLVDE